MNRLLTRLLHEAWRTLKKPHRAFLLLHRHQRRSFLESFRDRGQWQKAPQEGFTRRVYKDYREYLKHQASKLSRIQGDWLPDYEVHYREELRRRLMEHNLVHRGMKVLCLAARIGAEVKSFLDLGCFAVGLDVNPGTKNKYVVYGDFHSLQFPDGCVDVVFTNSLDHVLDIEKVVTEVRRVLKPGGMFVLEAMKGSVEGVETGPYESLHWSQIDDLLAFLEGKCFRVLNRQSFTYPWDGEHLCLRREDERTSRAGSA